MSDQPKIGDKVRLTRELVVSGSDRTMVAGEDGFWFGLDGWTVEVLERADDPSKDPIGTVRENTGGYGGVYVRFGDPDDSRTWQHVVVGYRTGHRDETLGKIVGVVPGTPAAEAAEPEYEYYRRDTGVVYRLKGNLVEYWVSVGSWNTSYRRAEQVRGATEFRLLDGKPSDVD